MPIIHTISKIIKSTQSRGLVGTINIAFRYFGPSQIYYRHKYREMLKISDAGKRFEAIYEKNLWRDESSGSGTGSNLTTTENLRRELPNLIRRLGIKEILDVPCGDFFWMSHVMHEMPEANYIGGDIVASVVSANKQKYSAPNKDFFVIDLTKDKLPDADLIIVRDCLFHLSFEDIKKAKENIKRSNIKYILTTTHILQDDFVNTDIITGDFRLINIFTEPLSFNGKVLARIFDFVEPDPPREMCLFEVATI